MIATTPYNPETLHKLLIWASGNFKYLAYFTDNSIAYPNGGFKNQLFAAQNNISLSEYRSLEDIEVVGIMGYDLKNTIENLSSQNRPIIDHPQQLFFIPELKVSFTSQEIVINHPRANDIIVELEHSNINFIEKSIGKILHCTSKEEYLNNVLKIKNHIVEGDVYEINYCIAFEADIQKLSPVDLFLKLMGESPMPFSTFFKAEDQYLLCASPERFIKKEKSKLIAQPIKGTMKRGLTTEEDADLKSQLFTSEKERAENLMIVDLMRNDLSKVSKTGSVTVDELFGVYTFQHIHQMISTVSSEIQDNISFPEIQSSTFPMGSMTGAPKIKCMELIEQYENFKRGWFSGSVGYLESNGDFDFNVIIRSIFIDQSTKKMMFAVGSAITYDADPEQEYEECILKAKSIFKLLE